MESGKQHCQDEKKDNEIEQYKLGQMRVSVEKEDPTSKEVDDLTLRRFLRARDLDVEKASAQFLKYLKWKRSFIPNGSISESEIPNELAEKIFFNQGYDKQGRPLGLVFGGKHYPNKEKGGLDDFRRFVVYVLEKMCSRMPQGEEKFACIADLEGWGYSNCDIRGYKAALNVLQDCYPERLGKLLLVHVPSIFMTAWKIIYPFIDNNTRKKIVFVDNKKLKSTMLEDFEEDQLPVIYGGKLPLELENVVFLTCIDGAPGPDGNIGCFLSNHIGRLLPWTRQDNKGILWRLKLKKKLRHIFHHIDELLAKTEQQTFQGACA